MKIVKVLLYVIGSLLVTVNLLGVLGNYDRLVKGNVSENYKLGYYLGLCSIAILGALLIFIAYRLGKRMKRKEERQAALNLLDQIK